MKYTYWNLFIGCCAGHVRKPVSCIALRGCLLTGVFIDFLEFVGKLQFISLTHHKKLVYPHIISWNFLREYRPRFLPVITDSAGFTVYQYIIGFYNVVLIVELYYHNAMSIGKDLDQRLKNFWQAHPRDNDNNNIASGTSLTLQRQTVVISIPRCRICQTHSH